MRRRFKRVFLDYAATTPIDRNVLSTMLPYLKEKFGNPSAYYQEGLLVSNALETSREKIGKILNIKPHEVIFTGSGTEANNLALFGILNGIKNEDALLFSDWKNKKPHIITSNTEHPTILESCKEIEKRKLADLDYINVMSDGKIDVHKLQKTLRPETLIVSVILANNEIGTIQPLREIGALIKKYKNKLGRNFDDPPYLHTDASQAPLYLDINLDRLGVQLVTLDSSKIYGPKFAGCLAKKDHVPMKPIFFGGSQEFGLRPGTENVAAIVGFAEALRLGQKNRNNLKNKTLKLQKYFIENLIKKIPGAKINGSIKSRLPNNINVCIEGLNSEFAVVQMDERGVACSAMTACRSVSEDARSHVVDALYENSNCGKSSLRFTLGKSTTKKEIDFAIKVLSDII